MSRSRRITTDPTRAVAYLRVSTEEQNNGPAAQRLAIQAWAARSGVAVVAWHEDRMGGGTPVEDRDGLIAALADLRAHGAGLLVAAKRDRIARDVVVAATVERMAEGAGARVVTADGVSAEATPEGALMRTLLDAFAAYERAMIRARTRAALAVKRSRGEHTGGAAPYGFRIGPARTLAPEPAEQLVIERARALRGRGMTFDAVAAELTKIGYRSRTGRAFFPMQVLRMTTAEPPAAA
jgi:DNA invertase Pin-like site-specific DNA recombinase